MLRFHSHLAVAALTAVLAAAGLGCSGRSGALDRRDENHPLMRRALALKRANNLEGAIDAYQRALEKKPSLARAHLELALLYDQPPKEDFIRAAYHYDRYLELRPEGESKVYVVDLAKRARLSFAASLADRPSEAVEMIHDLKSENDLLRAQIVQLQEQLHTPPAAASTGLLPPPVAAGVERHAAARTNAAPARSTPAAPGTRAPAAPAVGATGRGAGASGGGLQPPAPAPALPQTRTYTVQSGDTLSIIASRMYNDSSAWRRIFEANRNQLPEPGSVKPGQVLVIPK